MTRGCTVIRGVLSQEVGYGNGYTMTRVYCDKGWAMTMGVL